MFFSTRETESVHAQLLATEIAFDKALSSEVSPNRDELIVQSRLEMLEVSRKLRSIEKQLKGVSEKKKPTPSKNTEGALPNSHIEDD
jgi:hypothetical protein